MLSFPSLILKADPGPRCLSVHFRDARLWGSARGFIIHFRLLYPDPPLFYPWEVTKENHLFTQKHWCLVGAGDTRGHCPLVKPLSTSLCGYQWAQHSGETHLITRKLNRRMEENASKLYI